MSRKLCAIMLALLSIIVMITLVVPSSLAYLIEITPVAQNTFVMDPVLTEVQVPVAIQKTVKNLCEHPISPEGFTFLLTNVQTGAVQKAVSDAEGRASFLISFCGLDEGEHSFTLQEQNDGRSGVTYDNRVYRIQVKITMDELPKAEITVNGKRVETCTAAFENIYKEEFPEIPDTGDHAQPLLWLGLLLTSGCSMVILLKQAKRKHI